MAKGTHVAKPAEDTTKKGAPDGGKKGDDTIIVDEGPKADPPAEDNDVLAAEAEKNEKLKAQLEERKELNRQLAEAVEETEALENKLAKKPTVVPASAVATGSAEIERADTVIVEDGKPIMVKVKFIKAHDFNVGPKKYSARKDDRLLVEMHLANKFVSRQIAYIVGGA